DAILTADDNQVVTFMSSPLQTDLMPVQSANTGVQLLDVTTHSDGQRLDNFLMSRLKGLPKSHLYRLIRKGEIRVNKKRCKPDQRLNESDVVRVAPLRLAEQEAQAAPSAGLVERLNESIIYEDEHLMVLNKPSGLAVHGGSGIKAGLIEALRSMAGSDAYRELVHRLDKETSGCLLVAKTGKALKFLQNEMKAGHVEKKYLVLVHGQWPKQTIRIDAPLLKHHPSDAESYSTIDETGKPSITLFELRQMLDGASLLEATLITGRTHQIRVHTQSAGHPVVGDTRYTHNKPGPLNAIRFLCLHSASLKFTHPVSGARKEFVAPMPATMQSLIDTLSA
ncbi:MAG: RluA family pseudouridine synthase, partial [Pseudohongiella sp.]|nr:RluA family pseudouridine synthase [Pseudohongiella sp.]